MNKIKKYWNSRSKTIKSFVVTVIVLIVIGIIL
jgi:CHASE3 domain sensor protein